jgi:hypothetical protein
VIIQITYHHVIVIFSQIFVTSIGDWTQYNNYMAIGDLNYHLLCPITNTRDKCLTKYDNYMVIGDLNYHLLCPITNTRRVLVIGHCKS